MKPAAQGWRGIYVGIHGWNPPAIYHILHGESKISGPLLDRIDIRVRFFHMNAADEDFAFDNLLLEGDLILAAVPEPTTALLFTTALGRRRRSRSLSGTLR